MFNLSEFRLKINKATTDLNTCSRFVQINCVRDSDHGVAEHGSVARAARGCRRCARAALRYSPTLPVGKGTPNRRVFSSQRIFTESLDPSTPQAFRSG